MSAANPLAPSPPAPASEVQAGGPPAEKRESRIRRGKLILCAAAALVILGAVAGAGAYFGWIDLPPLFGEEKTAGSMPPVTGPMVRMNSLVINLKGGNGLHYVKATLVLELEQKKSVEEVQARLAPLTHLAICLLGDKNLEDFRPAGAKEKLKEEMLLKLNDSLAGPRIRRIYFDEFLFQ